MAGAKSTDWLRCSVWASFFLILILYGGYIIGLPKWVGGEVRAIPSSEGLMSSTTNVVKVAADTRLRPWDRCGVFGDSFGALTCFFSAMAFWGMLFTLLYQTRQDSRSVELLANEHLPLLVLKPKGGQLTFGINSKKGTPWMGMVLCADECNLSENAAVRIAHLTVVRLPNCGVKYERPVNISNFLEGEGTFKRRDNIFVYDVEKIILILHALVESGEGVRPQVRFDRAYRNFLNAYGKASEAYLLKLVNYWSDKHKIMSLIDLFTTVKRIAMEDLLKIFNGQPVIDLKMESIKDNQKFVLECTDKSYYDDFCEGKLK